MLYVWSYWSCLIIFSNFWVWKWKEGCYFYKMKQVNEIFFPHWSFHILEHYLWFFYILPHALDYKQMYITSLKSINEIAPSSVGLWTKQVPAWSMSNANTKKMSCEELAQISFMERKELDTGFFSVCWISHHFFYFLSLSTQNISLNLACPSSSMCSRAYLQPSNSQSFPHTQFPEANFLCFHIHTSPARLARSQILLFATAATVGKVSCGILRKK